MLAIPTKKNCFFSLKPASVADRIAYLTGILRDSFTLSSSFLLQDLEFSAGAGQASLGKPHFLKRCT